MRSAPAFVLLVGPVRAAYLKPPLAAVVEVLELETSQSSLPLDSWGERKVL